MARINGPDDDRLTGMVSRVEAVVERVLRRITDAVAALVGRAPSPEAVSVDDLRLIRDQWTTAVADELLAAVGGAYIESAQVVAGGLADVGQQTDVISLDAPDAEDFLRAASNRLVGAGDTLWEDTRRALAAGVAAGESIPELAARVREVGIGGDRATTIARTEVIAASNAASLAQALRVGEAGMTKTWLATPDNRTREWHRDADEQTVPVGEPFWVGGEALMYPGQPVGSPANVINERCSMAFDFPDGEPLVAAAQAHTGAMIALRPSAADVDRLAVPGGEDRAELHTTLMYLGAAGDLPDGARQQIVDRMRRAVADMPVVEVDGFAISLFNPHSDDRDTCVVLGLSGAVLDAVHLAAVDAVAGAGIAVPDQHIPWVPHLTLAYTDDTSMVAELVDRCGPVSFDAVRVAFAGDFTDIPLTEGIEEPEMPDESQPMAADVDELQRSDEGLRDYWIRGEGAARIRWGTPGAFRRCTRLLGEHVRDPEGLCAEYYREATGRWPGERRESDASTTPAPVTNMQVMPEPEVEMPGGQEREEECPPGQHRMGGECMPDDEMEPQPGEHFRTVVMEGVSTGWREFGPDSITWRDPPFAYHWQYKSSAHDGVPETVQVGLVTRVVRDGNMVHFFGRLDLASPEGADYARRLVDGYARWSSVGADESTRGSDVEEVYAEASGDGDPFEGLFGEPEKIIFHGYRVAEVTAVSVPALADAEVEPTQELIDEMITRGAVEMPVTASATDMGAVGTHNTPTSGGAWDGPAAEQRLPSPMSTTTARHAYAWIDTARTDGGELTKDACRFIHHEISADGTPGAANLTACSTGIGVLNGGRGGTTIPAADRRGVYNHLAAHLRDADQEPPPLQASSETIVAAGYTITIPDLPPAHWFDEPADMSPHGELRVNENGRIWGYLAPANIGHRSFLDRRVTVPMGNVDYSGWMNKPWPVAEGYKIYTGVLTMDCGHASTNPADWSYTHRREHYENSCSIAAHARIGENRHGVWIAGGVVPWLDAEGFGKLMSCQLSGDWPPHVDKPGWKDFTAALMVPVEGFPKRVPTASVRVADGALVAAAIPVRYAPTGGGENLRPVLERIARSVGMDAYSRLAAIRQRVNRHQ